MLAQEQRFEPALLERTRQLAGVDTVVGGELEGAYMHE
jgi:hypothetical protein